MIVVVMGVSGSGKTTIGEQLARRLGCEFIEGDDFHPPENVAKMRSGTPLEDADRWPWLERLNEALKKRKDAVLACSALKQSYRDALAKGIPDCRFVFLNPGPEVLRARVASRKHRYMPASLLESQLATLEPPRDAIEADCSDGAEDCAESIAKRLGA